MTTDAVYEVTLHSRIFGRECLNVFHYRGVPLTDVPLEDIATAFHEQVYPSIRPLMTADVFLEGISCRDILSTETPFFFATGENATETAADSLPSFNAYSFTENVATNSTRPGHKRFVGPYESGQTDGVITDSTLIAVMNDVADVLSLALVDTELGLVAWAVPVIVKRVKEIIDGKTTYRLPAELSELVTNLITAVVPHLLVSSQTSRKD